MQYLSSIIVLANAGQPHLRQCLLALKNTLENQPCEILVIEQEGVAPCAPCSSHPQKDTAPLAATGRELFGSAFRHERFAGNIPRGALRNRGADLASGEFLVFMDSAVIAHDNWHEQLLQDFTEYPDIAATAPLLVNPAPVFDWQVRHMGTFVTPFPTFGALYAGIPATAPLARERRFFQTLDPACMMLRRTLLHSVGKFDERLSDGIEATELFSRLSRAGHTMTVNPVAIAHLPAPSPQIPDSTKHTLLTLWQDRQLQLRPDWHSHIHRDLLLPKMDTWGMLFAEPAQHMKTLPPILSSGDTQAMRALKEMLEKFPHDARLYIALARVLENEGQLSQALWALETSTKMHLEPEAALALKRLALRDVTIQPRAESTLKMFTRPFHAYVNMVEHLRISCQYLGLEEITRLANAWLASKDSIFSNHYRPLMARLRDMDKPAPRALASATRKEDPKPEQPVVSVIIPAYNYAAFLPHTLENVLAERGVTLDVIVVDDGSADNTREVVQSFGTAVRYIHQENQGLPAARNTGIRAAAGDFFVFLDADDLLYSNTLLNQYRALERAPEANMALCQNLLFEGTEPAGPYSPSSSIPLCKEPVALFFCCRNVAPVHAFMIRRSLVEKTGFFDTSLRAVEDYDYWLRCLAHGGKTVINPQGLVYYRQHEQSMSKNNQRQLLHEAILRGRVEQLLSTNTLFAKGMKPQGWVAHATRCFNLSGEISLFEKNTARELATAGEFALQNAEQALKEEKMDSLGTAGEASSITRYFGLVCRDIFDALSSAGLGYFPEARKILKTLLPETALGKQERKELLKTIATGLYHSDLPLSDIANWQMEHPWQR